MMPSLANLRRGEKGVIKGFSDDTMTNKFLEMGLLPGTKVELKFKAPFGDPICIQIDETLISLRVEEATAITIE